MAAIHKTVEPATGLTLKRYCIATALAFAIAVAAASWVSYELFSRRMDFFDPETGKWAGAVHQIFWLLFGAGLLPFQFTMTAAAIGRWIRQRRWRASGATRFTAIFRWGTKIVWRIVLPATAIASACGISILYAALDHNTQFEFYASDTGLEWQYTIALFVAAFIYAFTILFIGFLGVFILMLALRKVLRSKFSRQAQ